MTPHDDHRSLSRWTGIGALSACISVALGAFGAHGLKSILTPEMLMTFETGVRYQMYHAGGMMAAGLAGMMRGGPARRYIQACWTFALGTMAFSGSLYILALSGMRWVGALTPVGGILFMTGWILLASALLRQQ